MKVVTPAMKLDVRINQIANEDDLLVMKGVAGVLPCTTSLSPAEFRRILRMAMRPSVLKLLFKR